MKLTLPLSVVLSRKTIKDKIFYLNLNVYRNSHFRMLDDAKKRYKGEVYAAMLTPSGKYIPPNLGPGMFRFVYTLFPASIEVNRIVDLANVLPIVQKFTDDALIELGVIPDDNLNVIREIDYRFGEVDKQNPHAVLEIIKLGGSTS